MAPGYALGMGSAGCRAPTEENIRFSAAKARDNAQCVWVKIPVRANLTELLDLALLGARVLTLTAEVRDLQLRFIALEGRFAAMESRFSAMEIRLGAIERPGRPGRTDVRDACGDRARGVTVTV